MTGPTQPRPLQAGDTFGKYRILAELGRGAMGVVYDAESILLSRRVALKVLPLEVAADADALSRFQIEARAAARLSHPNAVNLFDFDRVGDAYYLAMEKVTGGSLDAKLKKHGPLNWEDATKIVLEMARVLAVAHRLGLIHRDIKPANILLADDGRAKLSDFGLAKLAAETGEASGQLTQTGAVLGTPAYLSPEQAQAAPLDGRSDQYSLGMTWYAMLTGRPPFSQPGMTPTQLMFAHVTRPTPNPRELVPGIPEPIVAVLFRMTAKAPEARYANAEALAKAIEEAVEAAGVDSADRRRNAVAAAAAAASRSTTNIPVGLASATITAQTLAQAQAAAPPIGSFSTQRRAAGVARTGRPAAVSLPSWVLPLGVVAGLGLVGGAIALWRPWAESNSSSNSREPLKLHKKISDSDPADSSKPDSSKPDSSKPDSSKPDSSKPDSSAKSDALVRAELTELAARVDRLRARKNHSTMETVRWEVDRLLRERSNTPLAESIRRLSQRCRLEPVERYLTETPGDVASRPMAISGDGAFVAAASPQRVLVLYWLLARQVEIPAEAGSAFTSAVAFTPHQTWFAVGLQPAGIAFHSVIQQDFGRVHGLSSPPSLLTWSVAGEHLAVAEPQPNGTDLVSLLRFRGIGQPKTAALHERIRLAGVLGRVRHFLFTSDGQRLLVITWDGKSSRQYEYRLPESVTKPGPPLPAVEPPPPPSESVLEPTRQAELPHQRAITQVTRHPDGQRWLTVDESGQIRLWEANGTPREFVGQAKLSAGPTAAALVDEGRRLLVYSAEPGTLRLFELDTGKELAATQVTSDHQPTATLFATPDGRYALVADVRSQQRIHLSLDPHLGKPTPGDPLAGRKLKRILAEGFEDTAVGDWPSHLVCEHAARFRQSNFVTDKLPYAGRRCLQLWGTTEGPLPYAAVSFLSVPEHTPIRAMRVRIRVGSADTKLGHTYRAEFSLKTEASNERGGKFGILWMGRFLHRWGSNFRRAEEWLTLTATFDTTGEFVKISTWIDGQPVGNSLTEVRSADFPLYRHVQLATGAELVWYDDVEVFTDAGP